jgi:hypothetical protein
MKFETLADISARMSVPMSTLHYYIRAFGAHLGELRRGRSNTIMFNPRQVTMFETIVRLRQEGLAMNELNDRLTAGALASSGGPTEATASLNLKEDSYLVSHDGRPCVAGELARQTAEALGRLLAMSEAMMTELRTIKDVLRQVAHIDDNVDLVANTVAAGALSKLRNMLQDAVHSGSDAASAIDAATALAEDMQDIGADLERKAA